MFRKLILILLIFAFTACKSTKKVVTNSKVETKTVKTTDIVKLDTTIFIPEEKVSLFIPIEKSKIKNSVSPKVYTQTKGRATVTVKIDSTGTTTTASCDSIVKELNYYKIKVKEMTDVISETKTKEETKKGFSFFELLLYITAVAIVSFVAGYLLKTVKKF